LKGELIPIYEFPFPYCLSFEIIPLGIMKCDIIASGVVTAAKAVELQVPLVVRLEGTNVEKGNEILKSSGLKIVTAKDLDEAATKAVQAIGS